ncbi:hypothetical protein [Prosthecobacter sp.]|uniref:hypothetical protein n=1 Tax=Prosthecobacter sp. TaxID=1965333 RepID=UPI0037839AE6
MFTKLGPQSARHSSGYHVYIAGRELAGYEDDHVKATLGADFMCGLVPLYVRDFKLKLKGRSELSQAPSRVEITARMRQGFAFLGVNTEEVDH